MGCNKSIPFEEKMTEDEIYKYSQYISMFGGCYVFPVKTINVNGILDSASYTVCEYIGKNHKFESKKWELNHVNYEKAFLCYRYYNNQITNAEFRNSLKYGDDGLHVEGCALIYNLIENIIPREILKLN